MELNIVNKKNESEIKPMGGTELMWNRVEPLYNQYSEYLDLITNDLNKVFESNNKKKIVWIHDLALDPKYDKFVDSDFIKRVHKFVFVSHWQYQKFVEKYDIPYEKCIVIKNAIEPFEDFEKPKNEEFRFIYTSTPHRGLGILFEAVKLLTNHTKDFKVDVFSSFEIYGWHEQQKKNQSFFDELEKHPNIDYHGTKDNATVREYLKNAECFVYPSIYQETYCLAMVEAMAAKCACIVPNLAVLPESGSHFPYMYQYTDNVQDHVLQCAKSMLAVKDHFYTDNVQNHLEFQYAHTNRFQSWQYRYYEWVALFEDIKNGNNS